jgi:lipid-A-disaccharide synthase
MIAGEASGDLHGSGVVRELKRLDPAVEVFGIGGGNMRAAGMEILVDIAELSFMGIVEVVRNIGSVMRVSRAMNALLRDRRPEVVVLIDYPGFNLRFARRAKAAGVPVLYYISPQVWAWNKGRVRRMKGVVDAMKVVFPFEVDVYRSEGIDVECVGHPLVEHIGVSVTREEFFRSRGFQPGKRLVGLFPGSRPQEIESIFPVMVKAAVRLMASGDVQVGVGVAPNLGRAVLQRYIAADLPIVLIEHGTYDLMAHADAAMVTSGTATLEAGWFGTPMVIVYRTSSLTFFIGRMLVKVPFIGLVNIVAGTKLVQEFIQREMTPDNLAGEVGRILREPAYAEAVRRHLSVIRPLLGAPGASGRVARAVLALRSAA